MSRISIEAPCNSLHVEIKLPSSKSISNRLLLIQALANPSFRIQNLSDAQDTVQLQKIIQSPELIHDCGEGGTTFRFLLALKTLQGKEKMLTGSPRMMQRPIVTLVNALNELGAELIYTDKIGFAPVKIKRGIKKGGEISIDAHISSQFLSALMMIGPYLENGLTIIPKGELVSTPYLNMTLSLMKEFGIDVSKVENGFQINPGKYTAKDFTVPPDWSAASYWYAMAAARPGSRIVLKDLAMDKYQGDAILKEWMKSFGVKSMVSGNDIILTSEVVFGNEKLNFDFSDHPDLAQTIAVLAALKGVPVELSGLSTLRVKETDRIEALNSELSAIGVRVEIRGDSLCINGKAETEKIASHLFRTYNDHRMAMSLSVLACTGVVVKLDNDEVVKKSYPSFFTDLQKAGFRITVN